MNETEYRSEWATKTGRSPSDIYIPEAIREDHMEPGNPENPFVEYTLTFEGGETKVLMEFHFQEDAEKYINPEEFVGHVAQNVLNSLTQ